MKSLSDFLLEVAPKYTRQQIELLDQHSQNRDLTLKKIGELTGLTVGQIKYSRTKGSSRKRPERASRYWTAERLAELERAFAEAPAGRKAHKYVREKLGLSKNQLSLALIRHKDKIKIERKLSKKEIKSILRRHQESQE